MQSEVAGNLRLFPEGLTTPLTAVVNYGADQTRGSNAIVALSSAGAIAAYLGQPAGTLAHAIVDVTGYFE